MATRNAISWSQLDNVVIKKEFLNGRALYSGAVHITLDKFENATNRPTVHTKPGRVQLF